ncbi:hypothetical protein [Pulveribacter sp.]|uniref:portal protein n=1 Tax=Pulveribacter sp. TaxID=2678893 RepID=UPI0028AEC276|nr:hypothetical protein [Pulveribacter sp.]
MRHLKPPATADLGQALTPYEFAAIIDEAIDQPPWRAQADIEADYVDGNQLDSRLLQRLKAIGIPPAKENVIGPAIAAVCGYEAKTRTDWRVTPDGDPGGQDVADALNYRLNQAERHSKADQAMSEAFRSQASVGLGWVEVSRSSDPFGYGKRCRYVHRSEIFWDMRDKERSLGDAAWLLRERFIKKARVAAAFPERAELIQQAEAASGMGGYGGHVVEGGVSTGLTAGMDTSRAWTSREQAWYRRESDEVCLVELWYRRWVNTVVLKLRGGRVVEFDMANPAHQVAVASGQGLLERTTVARVRRSYWMGPHCLHDSPSPYPHPYFPYVPFWGYREDMTGVPFGLVRDMIFPQDNLNSTLAKLRWGLAATRTERTKGAVAMSDEQFRRQVARPDADIILDADHFRTNQGARFEVKRDFQLNSQQFQLMADSRAALERVSGVTAALQGRQGTARSGLQEQTQLEQSQTSIADLMDSFKESRALVGEMLLAMEIEDLGDEETTIVIEGDVLNPPRTVVLNHPEIDPDTGIPYLSNDVQRTRMKVALEDVPSTSGFRAQQLNALSEAAKSMPPDIQKVVLPFLIDLMDLPRKKQVVEAIRTAQAGAQADPEAIREQVKRELMHDIKEREVALKERVGDAQIEKLVREAVQVGVQSAFSAMQAGAQVAQMPMIAPVADAIMQGQGYQRPAAGDDPNFPTADVQAAVQMKEPYLQGQGRPGEEGAAAVRENTSPQFPPVPQEPGTGQRGIETAGTADNLPA